MSVGEDPLQEKNPLQERVDTFQQEHPAPKVRRFLTKEPRGKTTETLEHGAFVFNAFDHLEKLDSPSTEAYVDAQNARTDAFLALSPDMQARQEDILARQGVGFEREEESLGDKLFISYEDKRTGRVVAELHDPNTGKAWAFLDSDYFSKGDTATFNMVKASPDGRKFAVDVDVNAGSAHKLVIYELDKDDKLNITYETYQRYDGNFVWDKDSKGFIANLYHGNDVKLRHHTLGQEYTKDKVVFKAEKEGMYVQAEIPEVKKENGELSDTSYIVQHWNYAATNELYFKPPVKRPEAADKKNPAYVKLLGDDESFFCPMAERDGKLLVHTNQGAPRGKIITVDLSPPHQQQELVPQHATDRLVTFHFGDGHVIGQYNHDGQTRLTVMDEQFQPRYDLPIPPQAIADVEKISLKGDVLSCETQSFTHEKVKMRIDVAKNEVIDREVFPRPSDLPDAVVERVYATSKDGTKIPMTIVRPKDVQLDGTAAVKMTGYGGFNIALPPYTSPDIKDWVSRGGIFVQANLRGGGEFGKEWYDAGRLHNKQNVFDDFAACAEFLSEQKYTSPERLSISGGSNGGLLTLATAMQRPELFGAVVSHVPVTDMLTDKWRGDYGRARKDRGDFENNMAYSPLHTVKRKGEYPPMLVATGRQDPTVPPEHTYKFVATMNARSPDSLCLMRVNQDTGHNMTSGVHKAKDVAEEHAFIENVIGPIDQQQFKDLDKAPEIGKTEEKAATSLPVVGEHTLRQLRHVRDKVQVAAEAQAAGRKDSKISMVDRLRSRITSRDSGRVH